MITCQECSCGFTDGTCDMVTVIIIIFSISHTLLYIAADCWSKKTHSACHVQRLTANDIFCTNTVQNIQSATKLYLH